MGAESNLIWNRDLVSYLIQFPSLILVIYVSCRNHTNDPLIQLPSINSIIIPSPQFISCINQSIILFPWLHLDVLVQMSLISIDSMLLIRFILPWLIQSQNNSESYPQIRMLLPSVNYSSYTRRFIVSPISPSLLLKIHLVVSTILVFLEY